MAKFLSKRQSNLNLGITSYTESETVLQTIGKVGIGTTNAGNYSLYVVGDTNITGVVSATTFVGAFTGTATSTTNIPNLTGAITSNNTTTSLGSFSSSNLATALTDETGSGAAVFATSPTLVTPVLGAASATSIVVSSGSTFTNGPVLVGTATSTGTASQKLQVDGGAYVSGSFGIGTTNPQAKLHVVGNVILDKINITSSGIITSSNPGVSTVVYYGDGSNLQGVNAFNVINQDIISSPVFPTFASNVGVSSVGISTTNLVFVPASGNLGLGTTNPTSKLHVVGDIKVSGVSTLGTVTISSGIISATVGVVTYYGDGSNLQGVNAFNVINQDINSTPVFPTFASNVGVSSVGISTTKLVFIPASGRLGIGTTSPQYSLDSIGDINSSTIVRAKGIDILEEAMRLAIALS